MRGRANTTGVSESGFSLLPEGEYLFEIEEVGEAMTKNNDPMGKLVLVVARGEHKGCKVWDNIVIPNEGSPSFKIMGRTKRFLHAIEEPYEGEFDYDTSRWTGKKVLAEVAHEIQEQGKYAGKPKAVISQYIVAEENSGVEIGQAKEESPWDQ